MELGRRAVGFVKEIQASVISSSYFYFVVAKKVSRRLLPHLGGCAHFHSEMGSGVPDLLNERR